MSCHAVRPLLPARAEELTPMEALILDFRGVTGLDSSAVMGFSRIHRLAKARGFPVVLTGLPGQVRQGLERGGLIGKEGNLQDFADLDRGVQWCEDQWLESNWGRTRQEQPPAADLAQVLGDRLDVPLLMPYLERQELPARACVVRQGEAPADVFFIESGRLTATLALDGSDPVSCA